MCELRASTGYLWVNVPYLVQPALFFEGFLSLKGMEFGLLLHFIWSVRKTINTESIGIGGFDTVVSRYSSNLKLQAVSNL